MGTIQHAATDADLVVDEGDGWPMQPDHGTTALAPHLERGRRSRTRLLQAEGGSISAPEMAARLAVDEAELERRRQTGEIIGVRCDDTVVYPVWQVVTSGLLPGLPEVLSVLRHHDPLMTTAFMLNGNTWLGGETPLAALRRGEIAEVLDAALAYGEQVAV
jgi:hypothetical protein